MTPRDQIGDELHEWIRLNAEIHRLSRECNEARIQVTNLRALLVQLQWDKAGYCPLCFPGEAPYRHTEDCPLGRALSERA